MYVGLCSCCHSNSLLTTCDSPCTVIQSKRATWFLKLYFLHTLQRNEGNNMHWLCSKHQNSPPTIWLPTGSPLSYIIAQYPGIYGRYPLVNHLSVRERVWLSPIIPMATVLYYISYLIGPTSGTM